ncbi:hypothetical protein D3C85_1534450 [compost metagenome]
MISLQRLRHALGEGLSLIPVDAAAGLRLDRDDHMQPLAAGGLDEGRQPQGFKARLQREGGGDHRIEIQPLIGVEVEGDLVRGLGIARHAAPGMKLQPA